MAKMTRRRKTIEEKVDYERTYAISEAVTLLNEISGPKFSESLDISVNLGIDPQKSDQTVRGATSLPHGSGKDNVRPFSAPPVVAERVGTAAHDIEDHTERPNVRLGLVVNLARLQQADLWRHVADGSARGVHGLELRRVLGQPKVRNLDERIRGFLHHQQVQERDWEVRLI